MQESAGLLMSPPGPELSGLTGRCMQDFGTGSETQSHLQDATQHPVLHLILTAGCYLKVTALTDKGDLQQEYGNLGVQQLGHLTA